MTSDDTPAPSPLDSLQRWFQAVTTHPGGVAAGSQDAEAQAAIGGVTVDAVMAPSSRQTASERLDVYARSYWARLVGCLEEEFPVVREAVGAEAFTQFAVGYIERYPSASYTLGRLSDRFVAYLQETALAETFAAERGAPVANGPDHDWSRAVVEIAALERAIGEVFDAPGGETLGYLTPEELAAVPADRQADLPLTLLPTVRLLAFEYDVNEYFTSVRALGGDSESSSAVPWPARREIFIALSRRAFIVRRHVLTRPEFLLLSAIAQGVTLGAALERLFSDPSIDVEAAAGALGKWFAAWAEAGLFHSFGPVAA